VSVVYGGSIERGATAFAAMRRSGADSDEAVGEATRIGGVGKEGAEAVLQCCGSTKEVDEGPQRLTWAHR